MKIELLIVDGCPSWQEALSNLRAVLGDSQPIDLICIETPEQARAKQFAGSPSIHIDGRDLFPVAGEAHALACRVYHTPDGLRGAPTVSMIRAALSEITTPEAG